MFQYMPFFSPGQVASTKPDLDNNQSKQKTTTTTRSSGDVETVSFIIGINIAGKQQRPSHHQQNAPPPSPPPTSLTLPISNRVISEGFLLIPGAQAARWTKPRMRGDACNCVCHTIACVLDLKRLLDV